MIRPRPVFAGAALAIGFAGLVSAGCAKSSDKPLAGATVITVKLTNDGCEPTPATAGAGPVTFRITNVSATKVTEVELLSGETIIGEKENLSPGLSGSFSLKLGSGKFQMYCPNATTEKWDFTVTGTASASALTPAVSTKLDDATKAYQAYIIAEVDKLVPATAKFTDAVRAGDITAAKNAFAPARYYYEEVEPVAESFGDLDPEIDARANDVDDPSKWTGFHRIEKALWEDKSLAGMKPMADKLDAGVAKLKTLVATATFQPAQLANGATDLLNEVASSKITGEEDRYSHTDLSDFRANIEGGKKAFELLQPALQDIDPALATTVAARFADVLASLQPYAGDYASSGYVDYSKVTEDERKVLTQKVDALAEPLSQVASKVSA